MSYVRFLQQVIHHSCLSHCKKHNHALKSSIDKWLLLFDCFFSHMFQLITGGLVTQAANICSPVWLCINRSVSVWSIAWLGLMSKK